MQRIYGEIWQVMRANFKQTYARRTLLQKLLQKLFQFAAVVFLLNTTFAYGACCLDISPDLHPDPSAAVTTELPPCHQTDKTDASAADSTQTNCCVACVPAMVVPDSIALDNQSPISFQPSANMLTWPSEETQLFRPPINV